METRKELVAKMEALLDPVTWVRLGKEMLFVNRFLLEARCEFVGRATVMARYWVRDD